MSDIAASCAGKTFEHHAMTLPGEQPMDWRCPACGDTGDFGDFARSLMDAVAPMVFTLQRQALTRDAMILVPSDAPPGRLGEFFRLDVFRVQGIDRPMVALPGSQP